MSNASHSRLQEARGLIDAGQKTQALAVVKSVLVHDRSNVDAWLLAALAASDAQEALVSLRVVLKLQPGHKQAQAMLHRLEAAMAAARAVKAPEPAASDAALAVDTVEPNPLIKPRRRRGCLGKNALTLVVIVLGMLAISGGTLVFFLSFTGSSALDAIDEVIPDLPGQHPTVQGVDGYRVIVHDSQFQGIIDDGEVLRFRFHGRRDTEIFIGLGLMAVSSEADTTGAMELFDPDGRRALVSSPDATDFSLPSLPVLEAGNFSIIQTALDMSGNWEMRMIGREGRSAGAYVLLMQCYPTDGCQPPQR